MRALLLACLLLAGCDDGPRCARDEFYMRARADTVYIPVVYATGDTVTATVVTSWTAGCAPKGVFEP